MGDLTDHPMYKDTTNHCLVCEANAEKYKELVEAAEAVCKKVVADDSWADSYTIRGLEINNLKSAFKDLGG